MIINHNIAALNTYRQLSSNNGLQNKSLEKLSSGFRINRAGDDAAGLAISEKMRGQIRGLEMASKNAQDGISLIQTAEGALQETHSILQRMKELATQAANGTNTESDRAEIQKEINQLTSEINRIGNTTEFNTQKILDGGASANITALGSNEAKGIGARAATATNTDPNAVTEGSFTLAGMNNLALYVGGINTDTGNEGTVKGIKFDFSDDVGHANKDILDAYNGGTGSAAGMQATLENLTDDSGLVRLGDLMDITVEENGVITFATKNHGLKTNGLDVEFTFAANSLSTETGKTTQVALVDLSDDLKKLGFAPMNFDTNTTLKSLGDLISATPNLYTNFKGQDGTAAKITGNQILATAFGSGPDQINADTAFGKKFDITINGENYTVTLDAEAIKAGLANGADATKLVSTLNDALKRAVDKDGNTVDISGAVVFSDGDTGTNTQIVLTMKDDTIPEDGGTPTLRLSGGYASTLLGGITEGKNAIGGTFTAQLQIGANHGQSFQMDIQDMRAQTLGVSGTISGESHNVVSGAKYTATNNVTNGTNNDAVEYALDVSTHEAASGAIEVLDNAIQSVSAQRSQLGAFQNRLEHTINNLGTSAENLTAAESRIRDVDMAKEMMEFTKMNILSQAATAMLAQANQQPQMVLQLLR